MKFFISIPTYNGGELWKETITSIKKYAPEGTFIQVIDSSSKDNTVDDALTAGFHVEIISSAEFNHGGTRNKAVNNFSDDYDIAIFLTQDAIPQANFIEKILTAFEDPDVACVYGRQLPHINANPLARHARAFSYPDRGYVARIDDARTMGIKTVFMSNSFSAYRISLFKQLGGFPSETILCEDMYFTAKAILAGYKSAYIADAMVRHSHNYSPVEEFKRYFDIGVFHYDEPWIRERIGSAGGEGKKFIVSEFRYLLKHGFWWMPLGFLNNFMKIVGYKFGQNYKKIPLPLIKKLSMHKRFWNSK